jgi:hypothetical protein
LFPRKQELRSLLLSKHAVKIQTGQRNSTAVGLDGIPGPIIKCSIDIFVHLLKYIFNLSVSAAVSNFLEASCHCVYF